MKRHIFLLVLLIFIFTSCKNEQSNDTTLIKEPNKVQEKSAEEVVETLSGEMSSLLLNFTVI